MIQKSLKFSLVFAIFIFGWTIYNWYNYNSVRTYEANLKGVEASLEIKHHLDSLMNLTSLWVEEIASEISTNDYSKDELEEYIKRKSSSLPLGLGITVAFEPYMFNKDTKLYAPFYDKKQQSLIDISALYDYTELDKDYTKWYTKVVNSKQRQWSDPYFAKAADLFVVDFGIPLLSKDNSQSAIGMISFTFSIESFAKYVNRLTSGYGFVASKEMRLILHPRTDYMLKPELVAKALAAEPMFEKLKNEESGHFSYFSTYSYEESELFFNTLENNWVLCTPRQCSGIG
jgi:hypothetical protein